jgi:archaellin
MTTQPPRSYAGLAIAIIMTALIIGTAVYASSFAGTTITITKTTTVMATRISTTTPTSSGIGTTTSIQIPTSSASAPDVSLGLTLGLHISMNATGALSISTNEANVLDRVNNVTTANDWAYPNTDYPCGNWAHFPVQYALFQGYYDTSNYTSASA